MKSKNEINEPESNKTWRQSTIIPNMPKRYKDYDKS